MRPTQDGFVFVVPSAPADVAAVETALRLTIENTVQKDRATAVGLRDHGQISRREQRLMTGEADTYLETYPGHYLMRVGRSSPVLKEAMIAFLRSDESPANDAGVEREVGKFVTKMLAGLTVLNGLIEDDALAPGEAMEADAILQDYQARVHELRKKLSKRVRGAR